MKAISLSFLTIILLTNCQSRKAEVKIDNSKSRLDLVKEIPFKNQLISEDVKGKLKNDIQKALDKCNGLDSIRLFFISDQGELKEVDSSWRDGTEAIRSSYEIWRKNRLESTIVIYPSFSQNAITGDIKEIFIVEMEYYALSGTFRMIFDEANPDKLSTLSYSERL
jgi:hypothetical protein